MMENYGLSNRTSFFLALGVYGFILFFVFFRLVSFKEPAFTYTDLKDSFIDIELSEPSQQLITSQKPKEVQEQVSSEESDIQKLFQQTTRQAVKTEIINQKATDFNALFGDVKEMQDDKTTAVQSSAKSEELNSKKANELFKQLNDSLTTNEPSPNTQNTQNQKTGIYDEFLGKITRIIEQRWSQYSHPKNIVVSVKIFIDADGRFNYLSVEKSFDSEFDAKVLEFLESQKGKFMAYPPKNKGIAITMKLEDKMQEQQF